MNAAQLTFYLAIGAAGIAFGIGGIKAARGSRDIRRPTAIELLIGAVVAFFDTLGIGSFAPTTAIFKLRRIVPDEQIPGTLNVGLTPAALLESVIFVTAIVVDPALLIAVVGSAAAGAWLGAGIVARLPRRAIQITMGVALLIAGSVFTAVNLGALPGGGTAMGLAGWKFGLAVAINFALGALMSAGIGLYAPCMITLALLGMHPLAAFPIMMGACALVQPVASLRFFQTGRFAWGPSLGLAFGSMLGVFIAAYIVKSLPLTALRWLIIVVIAYAAFAMLRSAARVRNPGAADLPITLRKALPDDIPVLESLIARSARGLSTTEYRPSQIEGALRGAFGVDTQLLKDQTYFVAEAAGQIVGCGGWSYRSTLFGSDARGGRDASLLDPSNQAAKIRAFFVDPSHARRGIGSLLLERCEQEARAHGFSQVELMATLPGAKLYGARGYRGSDTVHFEVAPGESIEFIPMHKKLA
ncbi:MAG: GNAT family N-acetyltransferase [Pseudomonadota bacterium]|nr:GNAT family N-acetyltransferase [Pseudomonadota bacterium]